MVNRKFTKLLFLIALFAFGETKGSPNSCSDVFFTSDAQMRSYLQILVKTPVYVDRRQTVFYVGQTQTGLVILERQGKLSWVSDHNPFKTGFSQHGDPRNPVLILGTQLAQRMDFAVEMKEGVPRHLFVPSSKRLSNKIKQMNRVLEAHGQEPISYLPVGFGLATAEQILKLSISGGEKFQMLFPYADRDSKLTVHEVSYHLSSLILPRHVFHRARIVTERNLEMINLIKQDLRLSQQAKQDLVEQISRDRSIELDFGTGNTTHFLGEFRRMFPEEPYRNYNTLVEIEREYGLPKWLEKLTQMNMTPAVSVVSRLANMLNMKAGSFPNKKSHALGELEAIETNEGHGKKVALNTKDTERMMVLMSNFLKKHEHEPEQGYAPVDSMVYTLDILNSLDRRIEVLSEAASVP